MSFKAWLSLISVRVTGCRMEERGSFSLSVGKHPLITPDSTYHLLTFLYWWSWENKLTTPWGWCERERSLLKTYTGALLAEGERRSCSSRRGGGLLPRTLHGPLHTKKIIFKLHMAEETQTLPKFANEHIKFSSEVVRKCAHIHVKEQSESGQPSKRFLFVDLARSFSRCFLTAINRRWRKNVLWLFLEALRRTEIRRG